MNNEIQNWFEVTEEDFENDAEREFLIALCAHSSEWVKLGITPDSGFIQFGDSTLTVGIDITDWERKVCLRALRIDFSGDRIVFGEDETGQFGNNFKPGVKEVRDPGNSPAQFADIAARFLVDEMARKIELWEWNTLWFRHRNYVLSDTGEVFVWSDSRNKKRSNLGEPSRITVVHASHQKAQLDIVKSNPKK